MNSITFTLMDLLQIGLMIAACYACYLRGVNKGIGDTLEFFEEQGLIEKEDPEFKDFVEYNDIGLPLAFLLDTNMVDASEQAKGYVVETWDIFLNALGLENDIEWKSLEQIFKYSEGRNKDK